MVAVVDDESDRVDEPSELMGSVDDSFCVLDDELFALIIVELVMN